MLAIAYFAGYIGAAGEMSGHGRVRGDEQESMQVVDTV